MQLSEAQIADIKAREQECLTFLKNNQMTPAVSMQMNNMGNDTFGVMPVPYLQDLKFTEKKSIKSPDEFLPPEKTV